MKELFSDTSYVTIVDGFPVENIKIPTVAVEADMLTTHSFELGNHNRIQERLYYIDVFANNKSQRDEFAYRIINSLYECIPVYDYDEGFPPTVSPTRIGCLNIDRIKMQNIRIS